jgi:talin
VQGLKATVQNPDSPAAQMVLINACQDILQVTLIDFSVAYLHCLYIIQPGGKLVTSAKAAVPTVGDQAAAMSLTNASQSLASALMELRSALSKAQEACGSLEIDGALDQVHSLERDIDMIRVSARNGQLAPLPGETVSELLWPLLN